MPNINVKGVSVRTLTVNGTDYISITDIAKQKNSTEPKDVVKNWMRLKNTLEYLGLWEQLNNPAFKGVEFDPLLMNAGSHPFTMSPTRWVELTDAIGVTAKQWRDANLDLKGNIRDYAAINELICLSNMENLNAVFINENMSQRERLIKLNQIAIQQMKVLQEVENRKLLK
ncbi:MAG: KilA-N domain-containing protein [Lutibacter sp.]